MLNLFLKRLVCSFLLMSCIYGPAAAETKISVFVSIQPQAYFVHRIGGDLVNVEILVPPGKSPSTYAPDPASMLKLARSSVLFTIGVPFEKVLLPKIKNMAEGIKIVDTSRGIPLRRFGDQSGELTSGDMHGDEGSKKHYGKAEDHDVHDTDEKHQAATHAHDASHGDHASVHDHDHGQGGLDPHIWMAPELVKKQAETICDALVHFMPAHETFLRENLNAFKVDLDALHAKIGTALAPLKGKTIFVFHPVFGYFADAYGLKQLAVERGGKAPRGRELVSFISAARKKGVRVIFVQPQFDKSVAAKIASSIDGAVIPLDPLAYDYIENLSDMALIIKKVLEKE